MNRMKLKQPAFLTKATILVLLSILLSNPAAAKSSIPSVSSITGDTTCRFGITSVAGSQGYNIAALGVGSYLDWGAVANPTLPPGVEYIRVLRLRDDLYPQTLTSLPAWVQANPGSVWVVGNEPDTWYGGQDALQPEVYADRFYALAKIIRQLDRTAQITFGPVVQPTPIRIRYLQRAWNQLVADAGNPSAASGLIDIWSPHAFILNEEFFSWGAGIPPGFEGPGDQYDIVKITDFSDTYSIDIFQQRIRDFRQWLSNIGERDKPVWITEYGSLFPPVNQPVGDQYYTVTDTLTSKFMVDTFGFLLSDSDGQTGMPADSNKLVQRWFWYSLNDHRYHFGGSLYNPDFPDYGDFITLVGHDFIEYQAAHLDQPDLYPADLSITPISYNPDTSRVNYRLDISIENNEFADATCAQVWVYDGDPQSGGSLIGGPLPASMIRSNYGSGLLKTYWKDVLPLTNHTIYVKVEPIGVEDTNPTNNLAFFQVYTEEPKLLFLSTILRK